jgi:hypothetical protein
MNISGRAFAAQRLRHVLPAALLQAGCNKLTLWLTMLVLGLFWCPRSAASQTRIEANSVEADSVSDEVIADIRCFAATLPTARSARKEKFDILLIINNQIYPREPRAGRACPAEPRPPPGLKALEYLIPVAAVRLYGTQGKAGAVRATYAPPG